MALKKFYITFSLCPHVLRHVLLCQSSCPIAYLCAAVSMSHSRADQQAAFLEDRQAQFKAAAIQAKASGDMELAKKYLRMAKVLLKFVKNIFSFSFISSRKR